MDERDLNTTCQICDLPEFDIGCYILYGENMIMDHPIDIWPLFLQYCPINTDEYANVAVESSMHRFNNMILYITLLAQNYFTLTFLFWQ